MGKLRMRNRHRKYVGIAVAAVVVAGAVGLYLDTRQPETDIKNNVIGRDSLSEGRVVSGTDTAPGDAIATDTELTYESPELATGLPKTNAIGINWTQEGDGDAHLEVRTNDGDEWREWKELNGDDRKDGAIEHSAILLTADAARTQYRFVLDGDVKVSHPEIYAIDATTGPDPAKRSLLGKLFGGKASAIANPRIYSRAEWGSPEPNGSPRWTPRYHKLQRVMVHHTVQDVSNSFGTSAARVRAIWYQHANNNNWGDIGYNYVVDHGGRIFQGRYYNKTHAENNTVEVEGGHTYGYNDRSIGIAAIGDFRYHGPSGAMLENIGRIAGFKIAPYKLGATAKYLDESGRSQWRIAGHRNYTSTTCPGNNLYGRLGTIRNRAQAYRNAYVKQQAWDYSFVGKSQHATTFDAGDTASIYIDLKNEGDNVWKNTGSPVVRLATNHPRDRHSKFSATWIAPNRAATFEDQSGGGADGDVHTVQKGETARFSFTATAPTQGGTYKEYFQLVADGAAWFYRDIYINWEWTVPPPYGYEFVSKSATPSSITPGVTTQDVVVRLKNTGTEPWPVDGALRLGTDRHRDHQSAFATLDGADPWLSRTRPSAIDEVVGAPAESAVDPGQTGEFRFTITVPESGLQAKTYKLYVRPVMDGVAWLPEDYGVNVPVTVLPERDLDFEKTVYSGSQFDFAQDSTMTAKVAITNTGRLSWPVSGPNPVRFATTHPRDRGSAFATLDGADPWLSASRASEIDGRVDDLSGDLGPDDVTESVAEIAPGETALFTVYLTADVSPGAYREFFSLVQDGQAWFPDPGYNMYLVVK